MSRYTTRSLSLLLILTIWITTFCQIAFVPTPGAADPGANGSVYLPYVTRPASSDPGVPGGPGTPSDPGASGDGQWSMAGANPERTSWVEEEVKGNLRPAWYKPFEPYILPKVQIITANNLLYISTSRGLYALDAVTGEERWVYPTELPLGHSPTIAGGVAFVGGYDHKLHAVDALTGQGLWTFEAGAGFDTNPLVVEGKVFLGNRDGNFYAIHAEGPSRGQQAWKFQAGAPVLYSAAYKDGVVFFAANNGYAYALDAGTGEQVWRSDPLPGSGFQSWWPVVYGDRVIFAGSNNYRVLEPGLHTQLSRLDTAEVFPNHNNDPRGTLIGPSGNVPGNWVAGTMTVDASAALNYLQSKPWRRTYFVLDRSTGEEREVAPVLWTGTHSGNRYPPVVGGDGVLYQQNNYMSDPNINGGQVSGWMLGTPYISIVTGDWAAVDEPHAFSAGGNVIYWNLCCDRQAGGIDISRPLQAPGSGSGGREWTYFSYDLYRVAPGYDQQIYNEFRSANDYGSETMVYGSEDGVYGYHGDQNPPVPYNGRLYMHRGNVVFAFAPGGGASSPLPVAKTVPVQNAGISKSDDQLRAMLAAQVQQMIDAGHLQPGYNVEGLINSRARDCADLLGDYFHHPGDTLLTLSLALPHLPQNLQQQVKDYMQAEFSAYPPYRYNHIGWRNGEPREYTARPPEFESDRASYGPQEEVYNFPGWRFAPHAFYALWKYAEVFPNEARNIFNAARDELPSVPGDNALREMPHMQNAFIAGYTGYLELQKLAGENPSSNVQSELNRLKNFRVSNFTIEVDEEPRSYCRSLNVSRNFLYMVPELADHLRANAGPQVQAALSEYERIAPYWFVTRAPVAFGEGATAHLYDAFSLFQARALILGNSRQELLKYLDVPAFKVGDLFYIQKLIMILEAGG